MEGAGKSEAAGSDSQVRWIAAAGTGNALLATLLGAFGAHALRGRISTDLIAVFHTGVQYHQMHSFALIAAALLSGRFLPARSASLAARLFLAGILVFCGSLYALAITGVRTWGAVTPVGGLCFLGGWLVLTRAIASSRS